MRIAVLGIGRMGRVHARNLAEIEDVDVTIFDPDPSRQKLEGVSCHQAASLDDALKSADGVVIASPTALHTEHIVAATGAGCTVFCEKPISLDVAASRVAVDHARERGVQLQVGFQRRFDPGFTEMRRLISAGELGDVYLVRAASHDHVPPHESYLPASGSIFKDMHIHDFDAITWLVDRRIESVFARGSVLVDDMFARYGDVDTSALTLTLEGGLLAVVSGTRADGLGYDNRTEVFGSLTSVAAGLSDRTPLRSTDPGGPNPSDPFRSFPERFESAYRAEMVAFAELVAGRGPNRCPGTAAVDALNVAVAAERSLAEGIAIDVDR
jgi:myo-inositol 2-dehydrogenase/D-chiro-inositol 1-dehydrogenase